MVCSRGSQTWHRWHCVLGAVVCLAGCGAASLACTHWMPGAAHILTPRGLQRVPVVPWGARSSLGEHHWSAHRDPWRAPTGTHMGLGSQWVGQVGVSPVSTECRPSLGAAAFGKQCNPGPSLLAASSLGSVFITVGDAWERVVSQRGGRSIGNGLSGRTL